jgi:Brp/Blh family beta-carotene 15,15'-monooxygenase
MPARRLAWIVALAGWIGGLGVIALSLTLPALARLAIVQWSPWLVGLFVLGIPHGAFDHRVGIELSSIGANRPARASGPLFYASYLMAAILVVALWFVSPIMASAGFLAIAALHFGQGDLYWSRRFGLASWSGSLGYRASLLAARSALPIALPILAFPGELSGAADVLATRLFGRSSWSISPEAIEVGRIILALVVATQVAWASWLGLRGDRPTRLAAGGEIAETLLLVALFIEVPPVLALGVYFQVWHSARHVVRLLLVASSTRKLLGEGRLLGALGEFQKRSLPMTCGAFALMIALGLIVGRSLVSVVDLGLVALVALSALTLPHFLVVAWMDARQGVWSSRPDPG